MSKKRSEPGSTGSSATRTDPVAEEPVEPVAEEPVEPVAEEPVSEEPVEPVAEEPVSEEPVEPVAEEPVAVELVEPPPDLPYARVAGFRSRENFYIVAEKFKKTRFGARAANRHDPAKPTQLRELERRQIDVADWVRRGILIRTR